MKRKGVNSLTDEVIDDICVDRYIKELIYELYNIEHTYSGNKQNSFDKLKLYDKKIIEAVKNKGDDII